MRNFLYISTILCILGSCGGGQGESLRDGKKVYSPEINEVRVDTLRRTDFHRQIVSNGKMTAARRATLKFYTDGIVADLEVANGSRVKAGDRIAELDREDLRIALENASIALDKARIELHDVLAGQGYRSADTASVPREIMDMAKIRSGYDAALNSYRQASYNLSCTILKAPFSGIIADLKVKRWEQTQPEFCTLLDDSELDVDFLVLESEYSFLAVGLPVNVTPFSDPSVTLTGRITQINPSVDKNGQIAVRARVKGCRSVIDGMNARVVVEKAVPGRLVVPRSAVVVRDNLDVLFTYLDGKANWVYVNILSSNQDSYDVIANEDRGARLEPGDLVIISNNLNLADGSAVRIKQN